MRACPRLTASDIATIRQRIDHASSEEQVAELRTGIYRVFADGRLSEPDWEALLQAADARFPPRPAGMPRESQGRARIRVSRFRPRRKQCPPDRAKARQERRRLSLRRDFAPLDLVAPFAECARAVLFVVAEQVRTNGACALSVAEIAARARCSRSSTQAALRDAMTRGLITVQRRPRPGDRSETNVVRIVSLAWIAWLRKGRSRSHCRGGSNQKTEPQEGIKKQEKRPSMGFGANWRGGAERSPPTPRMEMDTHDE